MTYRITLERNALRFSAAHFTTFGVECEPLHGHNYAVIVEVEGALTPDSWVLDFTEAKRMIASLCHSLDHKFLLPRLNDSLKVRVDGGEYEVRSGDRRYVMPEVDVAVLDIDNSTAERLAEWFGRRLGEEFRRLDADNVTGISVGIEEAPGQAGWFRLSLRPGS